MLNVLSTIPGRITQVIDRVPAVDLTALDARQLDPRKLPQLAALVDVVPAIDVDRVKGFARDAAYLGVGAVVTTATMVSTKSRELATSVNESVAQPIAAQVMPLLRRIAA